jgi:hypothetical protein
VLGVPIRPASPGLVKPDTRRYLMDLLRIIVAILLPPLGVFLQMGIGIPCQNHKTLGAKVTRPAEQ